MKWKHLLFFCLVVALVAEATIQFAFAGAPQCDFGTLVYNPCSGTPNGTPCSGTTAADSAACMIQTLGEKDRIVGVVGENVAREVKSGNSAFAWLIYNSLTDDYIGSATDDEEEDWNDFCDNSPGCEKESLYVHFSEYTKVAILSPPPGFPADSCVYEFQAGDRVPVYVSLDPPCNTPTRFLLNWSDLRVRQVHKEFLVERSKLSLKDHDGTAGSGSPYYEGLWADNSSWNVIPVQYDMKVRQGGHILEAGSRSNATDGPIVSSAAGGTTQGGWPWYTWYRNKGGYKAFTHALWDTFRLGASWHPSEKRQWFVRNTGMPWISPNGNPGSDSLFTHRELDYAYTEFEGALHRVSGTIPYDTYTKEALSDSNGVWLAPTIPTSSASIPAGSPTCTGITAGSLSVGQIMYGSIAWHLLVGKSNPGAAGAGNTIWGRQINSGPCSTNPTMNATLWKSRVWREIMDTVHNQSTSYLGNPIENPVLHDTGTSPNCSARTYNIYRRKYQYGTVWVRPIDSFDTSVDSATTAVTLTFADNGGPGADQYRLALNGAILTPGLTSIEFPAGRGLVTLNENGGQCCPSKNCCHEIDP